jgi:hypothetical protein
VTPRLAVTAEADLSQVMYGVAGAYARDDVSLLSIGLRFAF